MSVDDKLAYAPTAGWQRPLAQPEPPEPPRRRRPRPLGVIAGAVAVAAAVAAGVVVLHDGGAKAKTHGFTWRSGHGFTTVDDPHGVGATTINGVNDAGDLVGFYTDAKGNTDGMLAQPSH